MTHQVIEAHFDDATTHQLDYARQLIYERGFGSLPVGIPHMSLSSFQNSNFKVWQNELSKLAHQPEIEIKFSYLGIFQGENFIIYQGIIPNKKLNILHDNVHQSGIIAASGLHPHYYPEAIIFHSTLVSSVRQQELGIVMDIITQLDLPQSGFLCRLALVEYFPAVTLLLENFQPLYPEEM